MEKPNLFKEIEKSLDLNTALLEEVYALDFPSLHEDSRAFLVSQLKKTIGNLVSLIVKYDKSKERIR